MLRNHQKPIFAEGQILLCEATKVSKDLGQSKTFLNAPWRKKVKLIAKESQRFFSRNNIPSFSQLFSKRGQFSTQERQNFEALRKNIFNIFLALIGFKIDWGYLTPESILRFDISNKEGAFLSRKVRKANKRRGQFNSLTNAAAISIEDLFQSKRQNRLTKEGRNVPFLKVPIRGFNIPNDKSSIFWDGFDYCEWLNSKKCKN